MSLADSLIATASAAWNSVHAEQWRILTGAWAGTSFTADAQAESEIELESNLSRDARERIILYVYRPGPALDAKDRVAGKSAQWRVEAREDNPVNPRIKFSLVKIAPGKDT